jgi:hypothetical protein
MLASGTACVAEIAKLPAQTASKPYNSTNLADIASNPPQTLTIGFEFSNSTKFLALDIFLVKKYQVIKNIPPTINYICSL